MGCSVSLIDDETQAQFVIRSSSQSCNQAVPVVPVGSETLRHAVSHKGFPKQKAKRTILNTHRRIVLRNKSLDLSIKERNSKEYDLVMASTMNKGNFNNYNPINKSTMKSQIKNQFFKGLGSLTLCAKNELSEDFPVALKETQNTSVKTSNGIISKTHTDLKCLGVTQTNFVPVENQHHLYKKTLSESNLEFLPTENNTCNYNNINNQVDYHKGTILGCFQDLSIKESHQSVQSDTYTDHAATEDTTWSNNSLAFSIVYIADINSNLNNSDMNYQELDGINTVVTKEIPTIQLMQHSIGSFESLSLESEEVAVAVHQDFFNGFGDDFDDDLLFSSDG